MTDLESLAARETLARMTHQNAIHVALRTFYEVRHGRADATRAADDALNSELHAIFASRRALTL